ncbi:hypothetical protein JVT61DRAFT_15532 [Boletus reticuloceps]|uniref:DUF6830 domain-containing protein n=1 Tax=Boletus reticuloceps TaxID=495285 RepID=A0A8I3A3Q2_9AGAM|nr:hypothetical protein JVT61DRAFT_15532 [Boletus reticuloceps]
MPKCPQCLKNFATDRGVAAHLAQKSSKCNAWWRERLGPRLSINFPLFEDVGDAGAMLSDPVPSSPTQDLLARNDNDSDPPNPMPAEDLPGLDENSPFDDAGHNGEPTGELSTAASHAFLAQLGQGRTIEYFPDAGSIYPGGKSFLDRFKMDPYAMGHQVNLYFPFSNFQDWEMANFLLQSDLSMAKIDEFLSLTLTRTLPLSFWTAKDLRGRAELLPSGPRWNYRIVPTSHPTKKPAVLYYRDSLDCIEALFNHPYFARHMDYVPFRAFTTGEKVVREYGEWMSGDVAWDIQGKLPQNATLCGVILSSDKTNVTNMCGGKVAYPLLISLANIRMNIRNKASSHAFLPAALIPIPEFLHPVKRMRSVLEACLFHYCLNIIVEPLKIAAQMGRMMSDPLGNLWFCFTPLAAYIADTPEESLVACVRGKTSPVTMASHHSFGDAFRHPPRTGATTLSQLSRIQCDPNDVLRYCIQCTLFRLNGVAAPFWHDWPHSDPARFISPEGLHHWHRFSWDHDVQWCKNALGSQELDFRYSILHPIVGLRHFKCGITTLKQVGGRAQREIQRYLVAVIAGAAPSDVVTAIRALMDFRYLAQATTITSLIRDKISAALSEFHDHKDTITDEGLRRGATSGAALTHWKIPKLELHHHVAASVSQLGAPVQWSADTTEHAHIEVVKQPASATNNHNYDSQICRYLDCSEKCRLFQMATEIASAAANFVEIDQNLDSTLDTAEDADPHEEEEEYPMKVLKDLWSPPRPLPDLFAIAEALQSARTGSVPHPPRTFTSGGTAFRVNYDPSVNRIPIEKVAEIFNLPDLRPALADFFNRGGMHLHSFGGQRRSPSDAHLPFNDLQIWYKVRVQQKLYHDPTSRAPVFMINAHPPDRAWEYGRYDAAILQVDDRHEWPFSGLTGHSVVKVRLIMRPLPPRGQHHFWANHFLVYAQRYDTIRQQQGNVDRATGMHALKLAARSSGEIFSDVFPIDQIRSYAHLVPRFGEVADDHLTHTNSFHLAQSFWLNNYFDKEFYYAVSS